MACPITAPHPIAECGDFITTQDGRTLPLRVARALHATHGSGSYERPDPWCPECLSEAENASAGRQE